MVSFAGASLFSISAAPVVRAAEICCLQLLICVVMYVTDSEEWKRSDSENEHNRVNVSGLVAGQTYILRVVALGRIGNRDDVTSQTATVFVGPRQGESLAVIVIG